MADDRKVSEFQLRASEYEGELLIAYYLSALVGAVNRQTDMLQREMRAQTKDTGKWLSLIEQAITNIDTGGSDDAAIQARIDQLTARLKASSAAVDEAIKQQQP